MRKRSRKGPTLKVVAVHWIDAAKVSDTGGREVSHSEIDPVHVLTLGFIVGETKEYIKLVGEIFDDGATREGHAIPKACIKGMYSRKVRFPAEFLSWGAKK